MDPHGREELSRAFHGALGANLRRESTIEDRAIVLPSQRTIDHGSTWVRFIPDRRGCRWGYGQEHFHWGRVLTSREYALGRLNAGDTPEEIEDNVERLAMRHARGWRLSMVACDACGLEEMESLPMAGIWPCQRKEYAMAKAGQFMGYSFRGYPWFVAMWRRYRRDTVAEAKASGLLSPGEPLFVQIDEGDQK